MSGDGGVCVLDEIRFYDTETREWGYAVGCVAKHDCGLWREMFRRAALADYDRERQ